MVITFSAGPKYILDFKVVDVYREWAKDKLDNLKASALKMNLSNEASHLVEAHKKTALIAKGS